MPGFNHQKSAPLVYRYGVLFAISVMLLLAIIPIIMTIHYVNYASSANFLLAPDEWINRLPLAVITAKGELEAKHFFEEFGGTQHNIVFAQISVVVSTLLQNWNTTTENYLTLGVALGVLLLITRMAYLYFEHSLLLTLTAFMVGAWLVFNAQSGIIWVSMVMSIRLHVVLFFLAGLLMLMSPNLSMGRILVLSVIGLLATFSGSVGMMVWPAYFFVLLFHPSRRWRYVVILVALGTVSVLLYAYSISTTVLESEHIQQFNVTNFLQVIPIMTGMPFSRYDFLIAMIFAIVGIMSYIINALYVFWLGEPKRLIIPTALVIFSLLSIALTAVVRNQTLEMGPRPWYSPQIVLFWLALFWVMLTIFKFNRYGGQKSSQIHRAVMFLNIVLILATTYAYLNTYAAMQTVNFNRNFVRFHNCARSYPFTLNGDCLGIARDYTFDRYIAMGSIITNHLLLFNDPTLYPIPEVYEAGSVLWVNISDPQKAVLVRSAVLPQLADEYKVTGQAELSALMPRIESTGQMWVIQEEGAPLPSFEMENAPEIIYQERILPDVPYQLIGYALD